MKSKQKTIVLALAVLFVASCGGKLESVEYSSVAADLSNKDRVIIHTRPLERMNAVLGPLPNEVAAYASAEAEAARACGMHGKAPEADSSMCSKLEMISGWVRAQVGCVLHRYSFTCVKN